MPDKKNIKMLKKGQNANRFHLKKSMNVIKTNHTDETLSFLEQPFLVADSIESKAPWLCSRQPCGSVSDRQAGAYTSPERYGPKKEKVFQLEHQTNA